MKKYILSYMPLSLIAILNVILWYFSKNSDNANVQVVWIVFVVVWFNILAALFVQKKQPNIYRLYLCASVIVLALSAVNIYWLSIRGL